jgi:hypothetical protein
LFLVINEKLASQSLRSFRKPQVIEGKLIGSFLRLFSEFNYLNLSLPLSLFPLIHRMPNKSKQCYPDIFSEFVWTDPKQ